MTQLCTVEHALEDLYSNEGVAITVRKVVQSSSCEGLAARSKDTCKRGVCCRAHLLSLWRAALEARAAARCSAVCDALQCAFMFQSCTHRAAAVRA